MCGIVGLIDRRQPVDARTFTAMRDALVHRGPDDAGCEFLDGGRVALGHRRLSFLDLSPHGRQPLANEDGTVWVTFNGEIYNYLELRDELAAAGHVFATATDTEVLVHGYEAWGERLVERLRGMFAFGIVDLREKRVFLARDRFGIKPLYYTRQDGLFAFASELKAFAPCPALKRSLDVSAVADYLNYRYVPSPKTIWKDVEKLPPAHCLSFDYERFQGATREYWGIPFGSKRATPAEVADRLEARLHESVRLHARSDVPVGAFLSGGYDSSALTVALVAAGLRPATFAIGFEGWHDSEHLHAGRVAEALGLPFEHEIVSDGTLDHLGLMPDVYDEPIADISILPTWLVSRLARRHVKAVMSGEGGDELLGGYWWERKIHDETPTSCTARLWRAVTRPPQDLAAFYADAMAMGRFDRSEMERAFAPALHGELPEDADWFYRRHLDRHASPLRAVQRLDIKCFMAELVLVKVDRASMAHSLEVRVPFLDHELFADIASLHEDSVVERGVTKAPLRRLLAGKVPTEILDRPKQGFVGPDEHYRTMDLYRRRLEGSQLVADGIIRREYVASLFAADDFWRLWKLFILEGWYRRWVG